MKPSVVEEVLGLFAAHGHNTYSERVDMRGHALQAAALARAWGAPDALVLAALLHDVGHFLSEPDSEFGVTDHGESGGAWLAERFVPAVAEPVRLHVAAKRYLCRTDPSYEDRLSPASVGTLRLQGGAMTAVQAAAFEAEPYFDDALAVRSWDDAGKQSGLDVPGLDSYERLLGDPFLLRRILELSEVAAEGLTVELDGRTARFHAIWLRDNARGPAYRGEHNDQRLFDVSQLADGVTVRSAAVGPEGLTVEFGPDGAVSTFEPGWLARHCYDPEPLHSADPPPGGAVPWVAADLVVHRTGWPVGDGAGLSGLTHALLRDGVAVVEGLDVGEASIEEVAGLWGPVRETNYGRVFHVRTEERPTNLAYTPDALNVHLDNPYRRPVPGFQLLHCIAASEEGGGTVLIDGLTACGVLAEEDPEAFRLLSSHGVPFRWAGDGFDLANRVPVIRLDDRGTVMAVHYNNRSAAPFDLPYDVMAGYYRAYRAFARLLHRPELEVRLKLAPGECLVFDNQRVLHGRSGEAGPGRYLQGCYLDRDWVEGRVGAGSVTNTPV